MLEPAIENRGPAWYALRVKPQHEKAVATALQTRGFEEFLPLHRSRRIWSDRIKELQLPLFAGYVFCRFEIEWKTQILRTPGVRSIVSFGKKPAAVRDSEIESVKTLVGSGLPLHPWPFLKVGQAIRIEHGPLRGVEGIVLELKDAWRVIVSVTLLQRSVAVEVDGAMIGSVHGGRRIEPHIGRDAPSRAGPPNGRASRWKGCAEL